VSVSVSHLATALQTVLTDHAQARARPTGFVRRRGKLTGPAFVQGLVFGWLEDPAASLEGLADAIAVAGGADVTAQALDQRFTPAAADLLRDVLGAALGQVFAAAPAAIPLLRRFAGVYLLDSTCVALPDALAGLWPGCGGKGAAGGRAGLKAQVRWELTTGALEGLELQAGRQADQRAALHTAPLPAGALRLADLGYFSLDVLRDYDRGGVFWVSRLQPGTKLYTDDGHAWGLLELLRARGADRLDVAVRRGACHRLAARLIAFRAPEAVAAKRRTRVLANGSKGGHRVRAERLELCGWTVLVTNVPAERLSATEAWVLARLRWQIELLFKVWKSGGGLGASRSGKPYRVLCEVYAKLLGAVVQHWATLLGCWAEVRRSLAKAGRKVRRFALRLAEAMPSRRRLTAALCALARRLGQRCRINKRRGKPHTYQTLLDPSKHGLECTLA
jgi:Transposase DDE domain